MQTPATPRKCRVCQSEFVGHGTLCPTHQAKLSTQIAQANQASEAITEARIAAQRAERLARPRVEITEVV